MRYKFADICHFCEILVSEPHSNWGEISYSGENEKQNPCPALEKGRYSFSQPPLQIKNGHI